MADYASSLIQALRGSSAAQAPQSAGSGYELFSPQYQQSSSRMVPRDYSGMAFNPQVQTHQAAPEKVTPNKTIELLRNPPVLSQPQYDGNGYQGYTGNSAAGIGNMAYLGGMLSNLGMKGLGNRAAMATAGMLQGMETADINGYGGYGFEGGGGYGTGVGPGGSGTGPGGYGPQ